MASPVWVGEARCVAETGDFCGEGAVWQPEEVAVYWTDINRCLIYRWDQASGEVKTWQFEEPVTAIVLTTREDTLLVVLASRVVLWEPGLDRRNELGFVLPEWPEARCNDARVDARGVLWIASMQNNVGVDGAHLPVTRNLGRLFSLDRDGRNCTWKRDIGIGNTVVWSPDGAYFYTADSLRNEIYRYDVGLDGSLNRETLWFASYGRGLPDGSCVDADGFIWNCRYGGSCVVRIDPLGVLDHILEMPIGNPTTCVFGGTDGGTLFVTSASEGKMLSTQNGGLFSIETSVRGLPPNRFAL